MGIESLTRKSINFQSNMFFVIEKHLLTTLNIVISVAKHSILNFFSTVFKQNNNWF